MFNMTEIIEKIIKEYKIDNKIVDGISYDYINAEKALPIIDDMLSTEVAYDESELKKTDGYEYAILFGLGSRFAIELLLTEIKEIGYTNAIFKKDVLFSNKSIKEYITRTIDVNTYTDNVFFHGVEEVAQFINRASNQNIIFISTKVS